MTTSEPIYSHRCTLPDRSLWLGWASLYDTQIVIQGWTWQGRYRREIAVDHIDEIDWRPKPEGPNLRLRLDNQRVVRFRLRKGGGLWNAKLHDLIDESVLDQFNLAWRNGHAENGHAKNGHAENGHAGEGEREEGESQETG